MTWRLHIQTACLIETSMFLIVFICFIIPPFLVSVWRPCWNREPVQPGPLTGHRARLEEHEWEKSDEPTVHGRGPAPAVICETPWKMGNGYSPYQLVSRISSMNSMNHHFWASKDWDDSDRFGPLTLCLEHTCLNYVGPCRVKGWACYAFLEISRVKLCAEFYDLVGRQSMSWLSWLDILLQLKSIHQAKCVGETKSKMQKFGVLPQCWNLERKSLPVSDLSCMLLLKNLFTNPHSLFQIRKYLIGISYLHQDLLQSQPCRRLSWFEHDVSALDWIFLMARQKLP